MTALLPTASLDTRRVRFTREQYHDMTARGYFEGKRVERIRGEVLERSPIDWPHVLAKTNTADALRVAFAGFAWVSEQSPVALADSDPEPDIAVYRGRPKDYTTHPTAADTLLIVEVANTSLDYDTTTKAELYAEAGIREYWVLDLVNRRVVVFHDPAAIAAGGSAYRTIREFASTDSLAALAAPAHTLRVAELLP